MSEIDIINTLPMTTPDGTPIMHVCHGRMCGRHAQFIMDRIEQIKQKGYKIEACKTTCMALCEKAPNMKYKGKIYSKMTPISVATLIKGK